MYAAGRTCMGTHSRTHHVIHVGDFGQDVGGIILKMGVIGVCTLEGVAPEMGRSRLCNLRMVCGG